MSDANQAKSEADVDTAVPLASGEGVKERLVAAAISLFCEKGYHATSVREIVERAGVTKPVLYYYFKNKDGLFASLIAETMDQFRSDLVQACEAEASSFKERLSLIRAAFLDGVAANPQLVRFMDAVTFSGQFEEIYDLQRHWREDFEHIVQTFRQAADKGEIGTDFAPEPAAQAFVGMVVNQMRMRVYMPEAVAEEIDLGELLLQGLRPQSPKEGAGS
jgi:AcrR family transcriptional regulator